MSIIDKLISIEQRIYELRLKSIFNAEKKIILLNKNNIWT